MAVEPGGNLVVSDSKRHTVMRFDPTGHLLSEWGPRLGDTQLGEPAGVAVQGDNFYVLDRGTPRIFRLDASGRLLADRSTSSRSAPYGLNGLAVDPGGNMYAADTGRNRILVLGAERLAGAPDRPRRRRPGRLHPTDDAGLCPRRQLRRRRLGEQPRRALGRQLRGHRRLADRLPVRSASPSTRSGASTCRTPITGGCRCTPPQGALLGEMGAAGLASDRRGAQAGRRRPVGSAVAVRAGRRRHRAAGPREHRRPRRRAGRTWTWSA